MTAIWQKDGAEWKLLAAESYPDERTLHSLVEDGPQMLPLAGSPTLAILGSEVQLGSGWADLIAIETTGRVVIIEIKLGRNAEARRAVVAQALSYAAYLHRMDPMSFERDLLRRHLRQRGFNNASEAVAAADQTGAFNASEFAAGLAESLRDGRFRIVFVLDEVPDQLVCLVAYLETLSDMLTIDLVRISSYAVGGTTILVPQRVEPERLPTAEEPASQASRASGQLVEGAEDFLQTIPSAKEQEQPKLRRLAEWAMGLEKEGLARLFTFHGVSDRWTLLPRLEPSQVGLVTIWNDGTGYIQFWRSVFERMAPTHIAPVESLIAPEQIRQGNSLRNVSDQLLDALTQAYREAAAHSVQAG